MRGRPVSSSFSIFPISLFSIFPIWAEYPQTSDALVNFARFHAIKDKADELAAELRETLTRTRAEAGCLFIEIYRAVRDRPLFFLNSRSTDEASLDVHAPPAAPKQP